MATSQAQAQKIPYRVKNLEQAVDATRQGQPVVVFNCPPTLENVVQTAALLGKTHDTAGVFDLVREIRNDPQSTKSIALSAAEHPPHTDGSFDDCPPKRFLLQFVEMDGHGGGTSTFWSIPTLLEKMPTVYRNVLSNTPAQFVRSDDNGKTADFMGPMIYSRPDGGIALRYRNDTQVRPQPIGDVSLFNEAVGWIETYLAQTAPVKYQAQAGDIIIVNNDAVLHGRTALSPNSRRLVRRIWIASPGVLGEAAA